MQSRFQISSGVLRECMCFAPTILGFSRTTISTVDCSNDRVALKGLNLYEALQSSSTVSAHFGPVGKESASRCPPLLHCWYWEGARWGQFGSRSTQNICIFMSFWTNWPEPTRPQALHYTKNGCNERHWVRFLSLCPFRGTSWWRSVLEKWMAIKLEEIARAFILIRDFGPKSFSSWTSTRSDFDQQY